MSHHKNPRVSAFVQAAPPLYLLLVDNGHKEIGKEKQYGPMELRWCYTDDGKRMPVELKRAAHHARIIVEMGVPIGIGEDDVGSTVRTMLIGRINEPAKIRSNAQCVEVVPTHFKERDAGWTMIRVEPYIISDVGSRQAIKAAVAIAQIEIVGVRLYR